MAGAHITLEVDDAALRGAIRDLLGRIDRPAPALRDIGEYLLRTTDERYRQEKGPDGTPWAPNSDTTLLRYLERKRGLSRRRTASGGRTLTQRGALALGAKRILRDSGDLQDTLRYQLEDGGQAVAVGTNRLYGAMQQFGGKKSDWPHHLGCLALKIAASVNRER